MAHEARAGFVADMLERLELEPDRVAWDRRGDRWDTGRRAWELADPDATHHLVLQDDARVCRDLIPGLEAGLQYVPAEAIVSPYTGTRRPLSRIVEDVVAEATEAGAPWIIMRALMWGVGILAPTHTIEPMLTWGDRQSYPNYDRRVGRYFYLVETWPVWSTMPSLIDHRDHDEAPSLCGHGPGRVAHQYAGDDASALDIDWSGPTVTMAGMRQLEQYRERNRQHGPPAHG